MVEIKTKLAHRNNYGGNRALSKIKYLVIHYTGNDGDTDENNGKYFAGSVVKSSAHYFVDDDSITQSVPDNYIAWHCGGDKYASCAETGGGKRNGQCKNGNSLSIEICDDVRNGKIYPSAKTIENALELAALLMAKYNISKNNVIRHFDVTGKLCPAYWVDNAKWKAEFWDKLPGTVTPQKVETPAVPTAHVESARSKDSAYNRTYTVTASALNMRAGAGTSKKVLAVLRKGTKFHCYGYFTRTEDGTVWLYGTANGVAGFCSVKYLK